MSAKLLALLLLILAECAVTLGIVPLNPPATPAPAAVIGDPLRGAEIFRAGTNGSPPCASCHALVAGGFTLGPVMQGISQRAGSRIAGLSAHDYLYQSITAPKAFVVPSYRDIMYPDFARHFSEQDLADLIAYLMSL